MPSKFHYDAGEHFIGECARCGKIASLRGNVQDEANFPCYDCLEEIDKQEEAFWFAVGMEENEFRRRQMIVDHFKERHV